MKLEQDLDRDHLECATSPLWRDNNLAFPTLTGTTTRSGANLLGRHFKPLLKRAELPPVRFHDLRHTCATILLMAGKHPKFVQELLGHANISIPSTPTPTSSRVWTTRFEGASRLLLLPHRCHRGFRPCPESENSA